MNAVQDTSNISSLFGASASGAAKTSTDETKDRFLSLLVAQMKNQDPMHPLDNAQVTSQLAQLSTVQGIESMNKTLQALASSLSANQMGQAANLIGRGVLVAGDSLSPTQPGDVFGFELTRPADAVKLTIQDAAGNTVRTLNLGPRQSGINVLAWDGLNDSGGAVPDGAYRFRIEAIQGGSAVDATTLSLGMVNSVSQGSDGVLMNLSNNEQASYADIRQIF